VHDPNFHAAGGRYRCVPTWGPHMHILEAYHGRSRYLLQAYSNRRIWPADIAPVRVLADLAFSYSEPLFGGNFRGMFGQKLDHTIGIPPAPLAAELYVYIRTKFSMYSSIVRVVGHWSPSWPTLNLALEVCVLVNLHTNPAG
jgi:hypothetical protein